MLSGLSRYLKSVTVALALVSLACFAVPMYVITPFRQQSAVELQVALLVKQVGPWVSTGCVVLALGVLVGSWRRIGWSKRYVAGAALLLTIAGAYLSRVNVYEELLFHPLGKPQFSTAGEARLDKDDMLLAVRVNGTARAYPIREMGYHHVVNDTVGGEPIVATY